MVESSFKEEIRGPSIGQNVSTYMWGWCGEVKLLKGWDEQRNGRRCVSCNKGQLKGIRSKSFRWDGDQESHLELVNIEILPFYFMKTAS